MRLSEAIRIGSSWSKQIKMDWKSNEGTCALGSAYEGTFGTIKQGYYGWLYSVNQLRFKYPYLSSRVLYPGLEKEYWPANNMPQTLENCIWFLNDRENWTREQIADWVEKLEIENGWTGTPELSKEEIPNALSK